MTPSASPDAFYDAAHGTAHNATSPGLSRPLGVTPDGDGVNVAVWAPDAQLVEFCVFEDAHETRYPLRHRDGGVLHAHVPGIQPGARYGLRAHGPWDLSAGHRFNPAKLLLDPYARALEGPVRWAPEMSGTVFGEDGSQRPDERDSAAVVPKCIVTATATGPETGPEAGPDPAANRPVVSPSDLVIYETNLRGLTAAHPEVPQELRGTYAGMASPAVVDHLTRLGVTAVELLPLQGFFDDRHLVEKGLSNYWGYQPLTWFAPEPRYAVDQSGTGARAELRHLVHTLHEAGIAVIVDVVYNHSGEGDEHGPTLGLRGLHNAGYYRLQDAPGSPDDPGDSSDRAYVNDTGTGNTLAVERPMVLALVMDSLRYWATEFGVDGFRFDLAASVGRTPGGFSPEAAFFQAVNQDPVLSRLTVIAEPWDLGPGGYLLGGFPHPWSEWNDRFRDTVRHSWRASSLDNAETGSRLLGSAGQFEHGHRAATSSVNFITAHDGFTLADVVSYDAKHNEANGEDGRDGHDDNISDNLGVEGPTSDPAILEARYRRARGMLAMLFVSQGTPMMLAGDEIGNSQGGNNNAYAQDNPTGWVDWSDPDTGLLDLTRRLISLRRRLPVLRQTAFRHGRQRRDGARDVVWHRADGSEPDAGDWHDPEFRTVCAELRGTAGDPVGESLTGVVFIVLNPGEATGIVLPDGIWRLEVDTSLPDGGGSGTSARSATWSGEYDVAAQSVVVFSR
ncbi:glycogen debranching protein GlgX [Corynebacterium sp. AOP40-9SA-29]|uniref:glycogen debranching protein GlgX n=1 Tax=Corynebacterium sp. AOP40-9SA-29 TaxID=3457677 RepID=UPI0040346934